MEAKNVDDILVNSMQQNTQPPVQPASQPPDAASQPQPVPEPEHAPASSTPAPGPYMEDQGVQDQGEQNVPRETTPEQKAENNPENKQAQGIDEYGNPIEKPRTYTEEEVNRMIRDRLSRGRQAEQQPTQQQLKKDADDFKADPNSDESWEVQLNRFIDKRIETRQTEQQEAQWRQQEAAKQADFETRFNSGMSKYQDFEQVVSKVAPSITTSMMMATRSLESPASFIYAAAKMHPAELERISKLPDGPAQAMEIGRLHERMIKNSRSLTSAPKPIDVPKGDLPNKTANQRMSIDQRIEQHARSKRR